MSIVRHIARERREKVVEAMAAVSEGWREGGKKGGVANEVQVGWRRDTQSIVCGRRGNIECESEMMIR